ncbi:hypothetical protein [Actinomadura sp. CNU-125]|uniref:hypothetical protein n=1 Tax=Actinomadura sp. CNU-125 TaxID=1904961 RepID=UPI001177E2BF|nr:hypothetical protein [Actinomadura sp. CNU-125]
MTVATALLSTGCTGEGAAVPLPSESDRPSASAPNPDVEAIKHAYAQFFAILDHADSLPVDSRKQQLAAHMTDPQLSRVLKQIEEMKTQGVTSYGKTVGYVKSVQVGDNEAVVLGCQDGSKSGLMKSHSHKKMNRGVKEEKVKAYLSKAADGRWRVSKMVSLGEGC